MQTRLKLLYITTLHYPSPYANRVNVMKMSQSFNELCDYKIFLGDVSAPVPDILKEYGIEKPLNVEVLFSRPLRLRPRAFFAALKIKKRLEQEPPETVFYIRDFLLAYFLSLISRRFRDCYFVECHALDKLPTFMMRQVLQKARGIISTNNAKREEMIKRYNVPSKKILVLPNGFDEALFQNLPTQQEARRRLGFMPDRNIVMYTGSMLPWKGADIIFEIARLLPQYDFVLVGADKDEVRNNVRLIQKKSNREIPLYLRAADVLIAPYRTDSMRAKKYFSPIKVFEYMASGVPFVVTDLPAVREFLGDDEAYFAKEYSEKTFQDTIVRALENQKESNARASKAFAKVHGYSWQKRARGIEKFIQLHCI